MNPKDMEQQEKILRDRLEQLRIKPKPEPVWPYMLVLALCLASFGMVWLIATHL